MKTTIAIEFTTYDGQPGSRPPIFDPPSARPPSVDGGWPLPRHELDGCHCELMLIPAWQEKPLGLAFMLFYLDICGEFEWCSKYSAPGGLFDDCGAEVVLDEAGYISFPLQKGDRWAIWPTISLN